MSEKRVFPDNWFDMSEKQVLENVRYLKQNFKQYKIKSIDDNTVSIGNVKLSSFDKKMEDGIYHRLHTINNKILSDLFVSDFSDVCSLYSKCRYEIEKIHRRKIKIVATGIFIIVLLIADVFVCSLETKIPKRKSKEMFNQEIINKYQKDTVSILQNQR